MEPLRLPGNRLAVGDARRPRVDFELELARHPLQHRTQVEIAQRTQHRFVGRGVVLDDERGVLGDHPVQHFGNSLLVAALPRRDRDALHRRRELERAHVDVVLVVRVMQHAVEVDLVDFRDRGDVPGHGAFDLDVLAALQHEQMPDLEGLAAVAHEELSVLGHRALMDPEDAELAHERVHHDLEHVGEHVLLRVGFRAELARRVAFAFVEERRIAFGRIRGKPDEHVEQFGNAGAGLRRHETHRHEMTFTQRLFERRVQLVRRDLPLLEIGRHQRLVDFHDLVDELAMRLLDRREVGLAVGIEEAVDHALATSGRQVDRQALLAEERLDRREQARQIDVLRVDLVDDDETA